MKIHESRKVGSIGKIDSWGYGSTSSTWVTPTLFDRYWHMTKSVGGIAGPPLGVIRYPFEDTGEYGPFRNNYTWSSTLSSPFYFLGDDGRCFVRLENYQIGEFENEDECLQWFVEQNLPWFSENEVLVPC